MTIRSNNYWEAELPIDFFPTARGDGKHYLNGKSGPAAPDPPDYAKIAQTQGAANVETARTEGKINNPNMYTPYGTRNVTWAGDSPTVSDTLTPEGQIRFNQENRIIGQIGNVAENQVGRVGQAFGQPFDFSGLSQQIGSIQPVDRFGPAPDVRSGYSPQYTQYGGQVPPLGPTGEYTPGEAPSPYEASPAPAPYTPGQAPTQYGAGPAPTPPSSQPWESPALPPMPTMPVRQQVNLPPSYSDPNYPTLHGGGPPTLDQYTTVTPGSPEQQGYQGSSEIYGGWIGAKPYRPAVPEVRDVDQGGYDTALNTYNQALGAAQRQFNSDYYAPSQAAEADFSRRQAQYEADLRGWEAQQSSLYEQQQQHSYAQKQQRQSYEQELQTYQQQNDVGEQAYQQQLQAYQQQEAALQQAYQQQLQAYQQQNDVGGQAYQQQLQAYYQQEAAAQQAYESGQAPPPTQAPPPPPTQTPQGQPQQGQSGENIGYPGQFWTGESFQQAKQALSPPPLTALSNAPQLQTGVSETGVQYDPGNAGGIQSGVSGQQYQTQLGDAGALQRGLGDTPGPQYGIQGVGGPQRGVAGSPDLQFGIGGVGDQQRSLAGTTGPQFGIQGVGGPQRSLAGTPGPQYSIGGVGGPQRGVDFSGAPALPGADDFSEDRRRVEESLMGRVTEDFDRRGEQLKNQLIQRGFSSGTEGYDEEMKQLERARNDANFNAVQAGGAEQSRLFGLGSAARAQYTGEELAGGQFGNQAQGQAFGQSAAQQQAYNAAGAQQFGQGLAGMQAGNQAQGQEFGQSAAQQQAYNAAGAQQFGQELAGSQFRNQAQDTAFGQAAQQQGAYNTAAGQQFQQGVQQGQFGNQAQGQAFGQSAAQQQAFNQAGAQQFGQDLAGGQFGNQAQQQAYGQMLGAGQFGNEARAQQFGQGLAQGQFSNAAQGQQFGELAQRQGLYNAASGQQFGQQMASGQFGNQALGQQYGMNTQESAARNALTQNNWNNQVGAMNLGLSMDAQNFNMQQQSAMFQNASRQQQIQEQSFARNLALNEMNSARSGAPVQMPQFSQYAGGAQIQPPPIAQSAQQQQQYNQSVYNAQAAQTAAQNQGAYQLGGAALGAGAMYLAFSDVRLKSDIVPRGTLNGINVYSYTINGVPDQLGVLAQELAPIMPEAVFVMPNGFLAVDYGMLIEHWRAA